MTTKLKFDNSLLHSYI